MSGPATPAPVDPDGTSGERRMLVEFLDYRTVLVRKAGLGEGVIHGDHAVTGIRDFAASLVRLAVQLQDSAPSPLPSRSSPRRVRPGVT